MTVCIWPVKESWCELGGAAVDTRRMVQTCGLVFNLGIRIRHLSSLSLIYIFKAGAPSPPPFTLHLYFGAFIRCSNPEGLIIRPQKNNKNPQAQPSTRWANWSFSADSEQ